MKKVAITGGAGFIGAYLTRKFVSLGYNVTVMDNFLRGVPERLESVKDDIRLLNVDITNYPQLLEASKGLDAIFHLAAVNGTENFYKFPSKVLDVGVRGILNIVDACYNNGIKELVVASSAEAYQDPGVIPTPENVPLTVPDPLNPRYSYGASKLISEVIALDYYQDFFEKLQIFRPHNVYGPDMGTKHVLPQFILRLLEEIDLAGQDDVIKFKIQGDGSETRAFCHVDDLVEAFNVMYHHGGHREIYHLGNDHEIDIKAMVDILFKVAGRKYEFVNTSYPLGSVSRRCPSIEKVKALGYNPQISIEEGIRKTYEWYQTYYQVQFKQKTNELV